MRLVLIGGLGNSISLRGMGPGTPAKLKQLLSTFYALKLHFGALETKIQHLQWDFRV